MKRILALLLATLAILIATGCGSQTPPAVQSRAETPRNIIVLIGDGMGLAHWSAARIEAVPSHKLAIERMPVVGLIATASADSLVTDSAAAATAMFTGTKTNDAMVDVDPNGGKLWSILELARAQGKVGGVLTTSDAWDATPACFGGAHVPSRTEHDVIARQLVGNDLELIAGGGRDAFYQAADPDDPSTSAVAIAKQKGFEIVEGGPAFEKAKGDHVLALFENQPEDTDFADAPLPRLVEKAISLLAYRGNGFVLMAEHEGTDSTSHEHDAERLLPSLESFDEAIGKALDFAEKDGHTLVIVAGDHETGGLTLPQGESKESVQITWSTGNHTGVAVPYFAYGPGSEQFGGFHENSELGVKLARFLAQE